MHRMPMSGIFELFVPGVQAGEMSIEYEILVKGKGTHLEGRSICQTGQNSQAAIAEFCGSKSR